MSENNLTIPAIPKPTNGNFKDLEGQTFAYLNVIQFAGSVRQRATWLCQCICGKLTTVVGPALLSGNTKSCGCVRTPKHGYCGTKTYRVWKHMKSRCFNRNKPDWKNYGGRGISVCERWMNSFPNFLQDMGECPEGMSLERIDNNGDYCPENCTWATRSEQNNNKRSNRLLTLNGKTQTMAQWARELHINYTTIQNRVNRSGWSDEKALTVPV